MKRLKITPDRDAMNPREDHDNADVMFCKHGRYTLGDEDAEDPMVEVTYLTLEYPGGKRYELQASCNDDAPELNDEIVLDMLTDIAEEQREDMEDASDDTSCIDAEERTALLDAYARTASAIAYMRKSHYHTESEELPGIAICRMLSLYDHSGITIFAGQPTCRWDSGQVGWQYITDEALATEWNGDRALALKYMDATLETYDNYLTGEVYGFEVENGVETTTTYADGREPTTDIHWEHEDSCWGFYGDPKKSGISDHLSADARALLDAAANDIDNWQYTADVPDEAHED